VSCDDIHEQMAEHAEQMSLFDVDPEWYVDTPDDAAPYEPEPDKVYKVPAADFRSAYIVVIKHDGDAVITTELDSHFTTEAIASDADIRRSAREVFEHYDARRVTDYVVQSLVAKAPADPKQALRDHARALGLID
jgi:hypothetical protein